LIIDVLTFGSHATVAQDAQCCVEQDDESRENAEMPQKHRDAALSRSNSPGRGQSHHSRQHLYLSTRNEGLRKTKTKRFFRFFDLLDGRISPFTLAKHLVY